MNNNQAVYNEVLSRLDSANHPHFNKVLENALWQLFECGMATAEASSEAILEVTQPEPDTYDYWYATSQEFRDSLRLAEERFNNLLAADMSAISTEKVNFDEKVNSMGQLKTA